MMGNTNLSFSGYLLILTCTSELRVHKWTYRDSVYVQRMVGLKDIWKNIQLLVLNPGKMAELIP
jgi:hypothetical protein